MKAYGIALIICALIVMGGALIFDPTVSASMAPYGGDRSVYNLGALQYQALFFLGGAALFISGTVLLAVGEMMVQLERSGVLKPMHEPLGHSDAQVDAPFIRTAAAEPCGLCDRHLRPGEVTCSSYDGDILRRLEPKVVDPICRSALIKRGIAPQP